MPDVHLSVELSGERIELRTLGDAAAQLSLALGDVESGLTGSDPAVVWEFEDPPVLRAAASPNGVPEFTLQEIVHRVRDGFASVGTSPDRPRWPLGVGERAQAAIMRVVGLLESLDEIVLHVDDRPPLTLDQSALPSSNRAPRPLAYQEFSSVDGTLQTISVSRPDSPTFYMREHGSGLHVRCRFEEEQLEAVKAVLGKRVVVDGMVRYRENGTPSSIYDVTSIFERPAPAMQLEDFVGALPNLTRGIDPGDFIRSMRDDEDA